MFSRHLFPPGIIHVVVVLVVVDPGVVVVVVVDSAAAAGAGAGAGSFEGAGTGATDAVVVYGTQTAGTHMPGPFPGAPATPGIPGTPGKLPAGPIGTPMGTPGFTGTGTAAAGDGTLSATGATCAPPQLQLQLQSGHGACLAQGLSHFGHPVVDGCKNFGEGVGAAASGAGAGAGG